MSVESCSKLEEVVEVVDDQIREYREHELRLREHRGKPIAEEERIKKEAELERLSVWSQADADSAAHWRFILYHSMLTASYSTDDLSAPIKTLVSHQMREDPLFFAFADQFYPRVAGIVGSPFPGGKPTERLPAMEATRDATDAWTERQAA